ncbi:capsular biosynthesis protein [Ureibacillus chungkukjangi]|uniref:hypothetical protein n=1 Tax=Ureibacillus chungkukjangi TaxID=1202712 RepID=UPI00203A8BDF|nr:hypothetical protein [Ureibacillus chungkukjangi]MCM3389782.1 capsular biosynthesis protein [Ureibacillus chungkukjangi]
MIETGKVLVVDVDGSLCSKPMIEGDYMTAIPDNEFVNQLKKYKEQGFYIILFTSRQMRTFKGNIGKINAHTLPTLINWLSQSNIPYDEIQVGKPWCGNEGFYIDDRAVRPREFIENSYEDLLDIIKKDQHI